MDAIIREATASDFSHIANLFKQLWQGKNQDSKKLLSVFQRMAESNEYELLCAEKDGYVVGFASLAILQNFWQEGLIMYITTMIVDEKYRGMGIGKALINHISKIAQQKGCSRIELESAFHRTGAHLFYEKMGFEKRAYFFSKENDI